MLFMNSELILYKTAVKIIVFYSFLYPSIHLYPYLTTTTDIVASIKYIDNIFDIIIYQYIF